jgi:acetylglutamate kinase
MPDGLIHLLTFARAYIGVQRPNARLSKSFRSKRWFVDQRALSREPKRRYKRLVNTSKSSPSKEAPPPAARTPSAAAPGVADVLASVHAKAKVLSEALPFMQRYDKQTVVVKYGGHAMGDPALAADFARDIVLIKQAGVNPIVVHGGGPQIGSLLDRLNIRSEFKGGLRVTDRETVEVVEMVLAGSVNKEIVTAINSQGGKAVGISGKDANLMRAKRLERRWRDPDSNIEQIADLGFVGDPAAVDPHIIDVIIHSDLIPVVAPIGVGPDGETLNINADTFAGALASAMKAKRLLLLTDVEGVLDKQGNLIKALTTAEAQALIEDGTISGGMIPKIESCLDVIAEGVEAVVIINGKVPHAVLLELFTEHGAGTLIERRRRKSSARGT